jgi:CHAT domain-containing protein/tetratricopeptide (TPR) repeat protein
MAGCRVLLAASVLAASVALPAGAQEQGDTQGCTSPQVMEMLMQARWEDARAYYVQRLEQLKQAGGSARLRAVVCHQVRLGSVLGQLERMAEATALLEEANALSAREFGADDADTLDAQFNLAAIYSRQGSYDRALPMYRLMLPRYERRFGAESLSVLSLLRNTSISLHWLGNYQDALPNDERALKIALKLRPGPGSCLSAAQCLGIIGRAEQFLADTLRRLGRQQEALPHAEKGVELQRSAKGATHPDTLDAQLAQASVLLGLGRIDEAREIQRATMETANRVHGPSHALSRKAAGDYAASSRGKAEQQEGVVIDIERLRMAREKLGAQHPDVLLISANLAEKYLQLNQNVQGLAVAEAAVMGLVSRSDTLAFDDRSLDTWLSAQDRLTNAYIMLLMLNDRTPDAFLFVEYLKHRKLSLALQGQAAAQGDPALQQQIKAASRRLALLDQRMAVARSLGRDTAALTQERTREFVAWKQLVELPAGQLPSLKARPAWLGTLLSQGDAAVSYRFVGNALFAYVGTPLRVQFLNLPDRGRTAPSVDAYRLAMRHSAMTGGRTAPPLWRLSDGSYRYGEKKPADNAVAVADAQEILRSLSETLIAPVLPHIGARTRLLISVDRNLAHVPFDALPVGTGVLGDRVTVGLLPSLALYDTLAARRSAYGQLQREPLLAVGGAHYSRFERVTPIITMQRERGAPSLTPMDAKVMWQMVQRDRSRLPLAFLQAAIGMQDLPGSKVEVENIARSFEARGLAPPVVLTGERASEDSINKLAESGQLERFRVLHFSTHGYLSDDEPGLSAIVLSQVNRAQGTDGYLTAAELSSLTLHSDLVVVSACDSGASDLITGDGATGLSFALFQAGTVASLLTLWPIEELDSKNFMEHFYNEVLAGAATPQALQKTKAWARANGISSHVVQGFVMWGI